MHDSIPGSDRLDANPAPDGHIVRTVPCHMAVVSVVVQKGQKVDGSHHEFDDRFATFEGN